MRKAEIYKTSIFAKQKTSPRGVKNSQISLARGINGGFYNPKTLRSEIKVEVQEVLYKQAMENIRIEDGPEGEAVKKDMANSTTPMFGD